MNTAVDSGPSLHVVGLAVHALPDETTLVVTPVGERLLVTAPANDIVALLKRCDGAASCDRVVHDSPDPAGARAVLEALSDAGCLSTVMPARDARHWARFSPRPVRPRWAVGGALALVGDRELVEPLTRAAIGAGLPAPHVIGDEELAACLAAGSTDLVVCALAAPDHCRLLSIGQTCAAAGAPVAAFCVDHGTGWLGPLVIAGRTADFQDLIDRRRCLADDPDLWPAQTTPPIWPDPYLPPDSEINWMLAALLTELTRWLAGAPCRLLSTETEADPIALTLTDHPILPLPHRFPDALSASWTPTPEHLIDPRTGIVLQLRKIDNHPSVPSTLRTVQAGIANMAHVPCPPWKNDLLSGGSSFTDPEAARMAALGEAVERYCANWTGTLPMLRASYDELAARGEPAVDPAALVLFSERQYRQPGFPFEPFGRDLPVQWIKGRSLTRDTGAWLPASLAYINWYQAGFEHEPTVNFHNFAGVQAGPTLEFALVSAIEEVVERDAMMTWWSNRHALPALRLPADLTELWDGQPTALGQRAWAVHLDNQFDIPVVAGVLENTTERFLTIGFAARTDAREATRKAWAEALTLQEGSRDMDRPDNESAVRLLLSQQGGGEADYLKPWRADRAYLDEYRSDFHDVVQLMCQQQLHLDPRARDFVAPWIDVEASRDLEALPRLPDRTLATYRDRVERHGFEIFYAELTTPDVAACGLHVVRVLIPGLAPNFPAAFPPWGQQRVQRHATQLGWTPAPVDEASLNSFPLPYA